MKAGMVRGVLRYSLGERNLLNCGMPNNAISRPRMNLAERTIAMNSGGGYSSVLTTGTRACLGKQLD